MSTMIEITLIKSTIGASKNSVRLFGVWVYESCNRQSP